MELTVPVNVSVIALLGSRGIAPPMPTDEQARRLSQYGTTDPEVNRDGHTDRAA